MLEGRVPRDILPILFGVNLCARTARLACSSVSGSLGSEFKPRQSGFTIKGGCETNVYSSIPQFLPVMRGTVSLPASRDPEVLERLQPFHLINICNRIQNHLNACSSKAASDVTFVTAKIKEVDSETNKILALMVERQKLYSLCAEQFSKVRQMSQQLSRCNTLLNQNIESMEILNNALCIEERLEPFVWKTSK
ncbi:BLOC-1-related complex subunit 5 [Pseudolycoriella hygida]|uniref:BLOC-1-related complex subunit 5 n=1 Tax=Pseudolycoriella hygida TaxID=35572 RepID=A0A9Q0MTS4_9DIPT|nr:BLOC-1-related complex subunit 5 [Pseudolycoriella hygida]